MFYLCFNRAQFSSELLSTDLVLAVGLGLHPRHVGLDPVQLRVRVIVLLLQTGDLIIETHHLASLVTCESLG